MTCKAVQNRLSAYLDREILGDELLELRAHLCDCAECHEEELALRRLKIMLGGLMSPAPSPDLEGRLKATILAQRGPSRSWTARASLGTFTAIAVGSMIVTFVLLGAQRRQPVVTARSSPPNVAFDVQRDQAYAAGLDATQGAPMISVADYAGR